MPVYNSGIYLKNAVDSILAQSLESFELILVDDGSTDGSSEQCDRYARMDGRVQVIHRENGGICQARNAALQIARGKYIAFSDHDDECDKDLLQDNYRFAEDNQLDFVKFCKKWEIIRDGEVISRGHNRFDKRVVRRTELPGLLFSLIDRYLCSCVWDGLFNRSFLARHGLTFDTRFKMGGEDYHFMFRCLAKAGTFGINDRCYYTHYIRRSFSASTKYNPLLLEDQKTMPENLLNVLSSLQVDVRQVEVPYIYFYTKYYLSPVIRQLNRMGWPAGKKKAYLAGLKNDPFYFDCITTGKLSIARHRSYCVVHRLFAMKGYSLLFLLYRLFRR